MIPSCLKKFERTKKKQKFGAPGGVDIDLSLTGH